MSFSVLRGFNNKAVDWLIDRLQTSEYRGQHLVQHYRYDFEIIYQVLRLLNEFAPNQQLLAIRTRDLSKQAIDSPEWKEYSLMCSELKSVLGKNTQDVLRKIIYVDLERLGLIHRYNRDKKLNKQHTININAYVSISDTGLKLLKCKNELERSFLIGKQVDIFLNGCIENLLYILRGEFDSIDTYEYMFFVTAIDFESSFILTREQAISYIKEYRKLSPEQKRGLVIELQKIMVTHKGDKKGFSRKDFHNWKNETQSLFDNFLQNTIYFKLDGNKFNTRIILSNKDGLFTEEKTKLDRNQQEKKNYFNNHKVHKKDGFELHHIIPLAYSTSLEYFKLLDRWQNLIYIDAYSHRKIKQHIILVSRERNDLSLADYANVEIYLKDKENVLYGYDKKKIMLETNKSLREI